MLGDSRTARSSSCRGRSLTNDQSPDQPSRSQATGKPVCAQAVSKWAMVLQGSFRLDVDAGEFTDSEIIVMLGENGTGKTTLVRMLHGSLKPDDEEEVDIPEFRVSYKPQKISPKFPGSVSVQRLSAGSEPQTPTTRRRRSSPRPGCPTTLQRSCPSSQAQWV